jgi:hypothetical protein
MDMLSVMCITPATTTTTKAETVKVTHAEAMKHNIMSSTAIAKSTKIATRMWELKRKGAEREGVWRVRAVVQGRRWLRAFWSGRKGNAY